MEDEDHNEELKKMRTSKCFPSDGSKMENKPFAGFTAIDISDSVSWKFRIAKIVVQSFNMLKNSLLDGLKIGGSEEKLKGKLGTYESAFFSEYMEI
jgi:hypothetical protein